MNSSRLSTFHFFLPQIILTYQDICSRLFGLSILTYVTQVKMLERVPKFGYQNRFLFSLSNTKFNKRLFELT